MRVSGITEKGRRSENQDAVSLSGPREGPWLAAVADGMGGHKGGAHASRRALEIVEAAFEEGLGISEAVDRANDMLNAESERPEFHGMGTTIVGLAVADHRVHVFNVGDSRAYRLTAGRIEQVTEDHSFVAEALRDGTMTEEAAAASEWGNMITRSLGGGDPVQVDLFGPYALHEPEIFLLCSDGLHKSVSDRLILEVVLGTPDLDSAAQALIDVAFRRGSDDNISVVLVEFGAVTRSAEPPVLPPPVETQREHLAHTVRAAPPQVGPVGLYPSPAASGERGPPAVPVGGGRRLTPLIGALLVLAVGGMLLVSWPERDVAGHGTAVPEEAEEEGVPELETPTSDVPDEGGEPEAPPASP